MWGRLVTLWTQIPRRRRCTGLLLAGAWVYAVGGEWLCDRLGWPWWLGWAAIVVSGVTLAYVQGLRVAAWWRRQDDLAARAAAAEAARPRRGGVQGRVYVSRHADRYGTGP